jgi:hypothetical protein
VAPGRARPLPAAFFRALQRFGTQEAGAGLEMLFDKLWLNSDTRMSGADHVRTFLALVSNAGDKLGVLRMLRDRFGPTLVLQRGMESQCSDPDH